MKNSSCQDSFLKTVKMQNSISLHKRFYFQFRKGKKAFLKPLLKRNVFKGKLIDHQTISTVQAMKNVGVKLKKDTLVPFSVFGGS